MKKFISLIWLAALAVACVGCGDAADTDTSQDTTMQEISIEESETDTSAIEESATEAETTEAETTEAEITEASEEETETEEVSGGKTLVVYFSWSGNTKEMATYIAAATGGDLLEIEPSVPYSTDYDTVGELAKTERDTNARPEIANLPASVSEYDTILIGYPIWWHTAPMIIGTFLENYDLTGIDIYPFTQSASMDTEQFENSMEFVRTSAGNGTVHDGLFVSSSDTDGIQSYLEANNLTK